MKAIRPQTFGGPLLLFGILLFCPYQVSGQTSIVGPPPLSHLNSNLQLLKSDELNPSHVGASAIGKGSSWAVSQPEDLLPDPPSPAFRAYENTCTPENPHSRACKVHLRAALLQSFEFLGAEMGGNLAMDSGAWLDLKWNITHGLFWSRYAKTVKRFRFSRWNDDDNLWTSWIGHPMMGSVVEFIWIQNDPKSRDLEFGKSGAYWSGRLWAMIPSAIFSAEWLIGPISESSIGNQGLWYYHDKANHNKWTNGTGSMDLLVTPVGGVLWSAGEDWVDLHLLKKVRARTNNHFKLFVTSLLTPTKSGANILRFRTPWYRDSEHAAPIGPAD